MTDNREGPLLKHDLDEDDKIHITEVFHDKIAALLIQMDAKIGNICCEFAGSQ